MRRECIFREREEQVMMAYTDFAEVYDTFMDNVPYEVWALRIKELLTEYQIRDGLLLDLGCGTGTLTEQMADYGYDMIGVDCSEEMLDVAMEKRGVSGHDILYLCQDMTEFELYGTVRAIYSACDCINYITEPEDLREVFRLANNYLDPEGVFLFDFNTEYKYKDVLGGTTIAENREDSAFIWENTYYEEEKINEYELTLFLQRDGDLFERKEEIHYQRAYTLTEIKGLLKEAGLTFLAAFDGYTDQPATETSERILIAAMEKGKRV